MVISFGHDAPWAELITGEEVITFRNQRRRSPNGTTWCNRGRGEPKEFDVVVEEIGRVDPNDGDLEPFVSNSGFDSVDEWRAAIRASNGTLPESGWLYRVKTRAATLNAVDRP